MGAKFDSVWDALFEDKSEAENLRIRSELMMNVSQYIHDNGLTQREAAQRFEVSQPRISDIINGKIDKFTIDSLVNIITKTGAKVDLVVTKKEHEENESSLTDLGDSPWPFKVLNGGRKTKKVVPAFPIECEESDEFIASSERKYACIG